MVRVFVLLVVLAGGCLFILIAKPFASVGTLPSAKTAADKNASFLSGQVEPLRSALDLPPPPPDVAGMDTAFALYQKGDLAGGDKIARAFSDPLKNTAMEWVALRSSPRQVGYSRLSSFLQKHPNWPTATWLRRRAEEALASDPASLAQFKVFVANNPPETQAGKLAYARILVESGRDSEAAPLVRQVWREGDLAETLENGILVKYGSLLTKDDHKFRADRLVYKEQVSAALRAARLAGPDTMMIISARAEQLNEATAPKALPLLPASLQNDPGLLFTKVRMARRAGKLAEAAALLHSAPRDPGALVDGDQWWVERRIISRKFLDQGDAKTAWQICAEHSAETPAMKAEAEFQAGWIALRYMNEPETAARHFTLLAGIGDTPETMARAAYWRGRTIDAVNASATPSEKPADAIAYAETGSRPADAASYYARAALYIGTYYGQLARARLGMKDVTLPPLPKPAEGLARDEAVRTVEILYEAGVRDLGFSLANDIAARSTDLSQLGALAQILDYYSDARASLLVGKTAMHRSFPLHALSFPSYGVPEFQPLENSVDRATVFAIARQESSFDPKAGSSAGAKGLMQMLPATARETASRAKVPFDEARLTGDTAFNAQLGAAHLGNLLRAYNGSYILTFAAYNAGGRRVQEWLALYGDPRKQGVDPVDWVERIPVTETRNYVQRVMENMEIYRSRLDGTKPLLADQDLRRTEAKL